MKTTLCILLLFVLFCSYSHVQAQERPTIEWLTFEQLEDSLAKEPKKVLIDFYTDWCTYCKKMDKKVFTRPEVINAISEDYYAVRMDAESNDSIIFEGQVFLNRLATKKRAGVHDLALLLGQRDGQFAPPTLLVLNEDFKILDRRFEYLYSEKLLNWLAEFE